MSKFVSLIEKFNEEEKSQKALAIKNGNILKNRLEAKIKSLEADKEEARNDLADAEEKVNQAVATNTRDCDAWLETVREAEEEVTEVQETLKNIEFTIEDVQKKIEFFTED